MVELVFYIWLLGATLIFVAVAMTGEANDRFEGLWLISLAAIWPIILVMFVVGALATMVSIVISWSR